MKSYKNLLSILFLFLLLLHSFAFAQEAKEAQKEHFYLQLNRAIKRLEHFEKNRMKEQKKINTNLL